jgi:DNA-binding transcriptional LysR family regulator
MAPVNDLSTRRLRLFLLLAEEMHFGRAAERAFMTQPAFSQQIASLEHHLGVTLVERRTRTAGLTPAGDELLEHARTVVESADRLLRAADAHRASLSGRVVIASLEAAVSLPPVAGILQALKRRHPDLEVVIHRSGFTASRVLLDGEVDVSFLYPPVLPGIRTLTVATDSRLACMSAADPLADQGPLTLAQLADRPFIGWSPKVPKVWRDFWSCDPRPDGAPVTYTDHEVEEFEPALSAIAHGEGIEFPPAAARFLYQRPSVAYVEVTDLPPCTMDLAWRAQDENKPIVAALCEAAREVLSGKA